MRHEIGEGHFAGHDERRQSREQSDQKQQAAESFDDRREDDQTCQRRPRLGEAEELREPVLQKEQRDNNAQDA